MSKYGVFSSPYFPVFVLIREIYSGKYRPEKTPYLDTFHAVYISANSSFYKEMIYLIIMLSPFWESIFISKVTVELECWPDLADLVTFTEEIPNGKLLFLCSERIYFLSSFYQTFTIERFVSLWLPHEFFCSYIQFC